jgi:HemY protein
MKGLFWAIGAFALAVGVSITLRANDGYALLVLPPYRVEVSLALLAVLLVAGFLVAYALVRGAAAVTGLPARVRAFRQRQKEEAAHGALLGALQALFEGRFARAEKLAARAWDLGAQQRPIGPAVSLIAARAAQRVRNTERRDLWLGRADAAGSHGDGDAGEGWRSAALATRGELLVDARDYEAARAVLRGLNDSGPRHIATLQLLLRAEQALGHWEEVTRIARLLEKRSGLPPEALASILVKARIALLQKRTHDPRTLTEHWGDIPERERRQPALALAAARAFMQHGDCRRAHAIIEEVLAKDWSPNLVLLYGECRDEDALSRIERAEAWLRARPRDWPLLLTLGRLCAQRELWGKAQSYLDASLSVHPSRAAHVALAQLFERIGRVHDANRHYRAAADAGLPPGTAEA